MRSNGTSEENIENRTKSDSNFAANFVDNHVLQDIHFNERSLINIYIPKKVISIYLLCNKSIVKKLRDFALDNGLFGSVKLRLLIRININIAAIAEDLILIQNFHLQMEIW